MKLKVDSLVISIDIYGYYLRKISNILFLIIILFLVDKKVFMYYRNTNKIYRIKYPALIGTQQRLATTLPQNLKCEAVA